MTEEPLKCRMCANPAVGESIWCSDDCSEAYFAQEPPEDDEDWPMTDDDFPTEETPEEEA